MINDIIKAALKAILVGFGMIMAVFLLLMALSPFASAFAHGPETPEMTPEEVGLAACQTVAARAAWGAMAGFAGAPAKFIYEPIEKVKEIAAQSDETVPTDGIHVGQWGDENDNDLAARKEYEEAAFAGWKQSQIWTQQGKTNPGMHMLLALFVQHLCHQEQ